VLLLPPLLLVTGLLHPGQARTMTTLLVHHSNMKEYPPGQDTAEYMVRLLEQFFPVLSNTRYLPVSISWVH
jgi:hypothetical protein